MHNAGAFRQTAESRAQGICLRDRALRRRRRIHLPRRPRSERRRERARKRRRVSRGRIELSGREPFERGGERLLEKHAAARLRIGGRRHRWIVLRGRRVRYRAFVGDGVEDAILVARCREGDAGAWRELVDRYSRYVYAIATRGFGLSGDEAEDVFQEAFTRAYLNLSNLRHDAAVRPWLAQVTRRLAIDRIHARARDHPEAALELGLQQSERTIEQIDAALDVHMAMASLPEHCHEILDRFFARDESYRKIALDLDVPMGTIASRIARCLEKLRASLEGKNLPDSAVR
jgi:RNA polymerase sigma factor (sigma-70 family)